MRLLMPEGTSCERRINEVMEPHPGFQEQRGRSEVEIDAAYRLLTEEAGCVLRPSFGVVEVSGPDAIEFLQGQLSNDLEALSPGSGTYAALLDRKAHITADCRVAVLDRERILLIAESPAAETLASHLDTYRIGRKVEVVDSTGDRAAVSLIGPATRSLLELGPVNREDSNAPVVVQGIDCLAVGTVEGVDLICADSDLEALVVALAEKGFVEVPEEASEIIRIESGRPRFGWELDRTLMPAEAGIVERAVSFEKGCYLGQEPVARLHYKGRPNRVLRGLRASKPLETGQTIRGEGRDLGVVSSCCVSPALGPIALAVVRREAEPGSKVEVGDDAIEAEVAALPLRDAPSLH